MALWHLGWLVIGRAFIQQKTFLLKVYLNYFLTWYSIFMSDRKNLAKTCVRCTCVINGVLVVSGIILLSCGFVNSSFWQLLVGGIVLSAGMVWLLVLICLNYLTKKSENEYIVRSPEIQLVVVRPFDVETDVEDRSLQTNSSNHQNPPAYNSISPRSQQENLDVPHCSIVQSPSRVSINSSLSASSKHATQVDPYAEGSVSPTYEEATSTIDFEL